MGLAAQGSLRILPETGPRPLVVRGAQLESSSYEGPLGRRENGVEFNERAWKEQGRFKLREEARQTKELTCKV